MFSIDEICHYISQLPEPLGFGIYENKIVNIQARYKYGNFYVLNQPFLLSSESFAILGNTIIIKEGELQSGNINIQRGDKITLQQVENISMTKIYINDVFIYQCQSQAFNLKGHFIAKIDDSNVLDDVLSCLVSRSFNKNFIQSWEKITPEIINSAIQQSSTLPYLFSILQCLTMSPLPATDKLLTYVFQHTSSKTLEKYHKVQVHLAFTFFCLLEEEEVSQLIDYIFYLAKTTAHVQSGVTAQIWRGLIRYARLNNNTNFMTQISLLLTSHVIPESEGRQEIYEFDNKMRRILYSHYLNQYVRAYDSAQFEEDIRFLLQKFSNLTNQIIILGANTFYNQGFFKELVMNINNIDLLLQPDLHKLTSFYPLLSLLHSGVPDIRDKLISIEIIPGSLIFYFILINCYYEEDVDLQIINQAFELSRKCKFSLLFCLQHFKQHTQQQQSAIIYRVIKGKFSDLEYHFQFLLKYEKLLPEGSIDLSSGCYFESQFDQLVLNNKHIITYEQIFQSDVDNLLIQLGKKQQPAKIQEQQIQLDDDLQNGICCPICFESNEMVKFGCNHDICFKCFRKVKECPMCRQKLVKIVWDEQIIEDEGIEESQDEIPFDM
ncbi:hypothetical protein SS50377_23721 [Spironucleus salmonicida]|uniref:RING-type domain-containing protein n=1 Tax=Spironucleus salmonicida TaxID=348837 RepID=V6LP68_9EUKA|nr:hypothetical protein SS50377_23721 [Spironucleus salmonicida]|eukprot:EST46400.1 hypothetical protein SS50377_13484 [Spironucleus salmonicida]